MQPYVVVAGSNGALGSRIVAALRSQQVPTRALVRSDTPAPLPAHGAEVVAVNYRDQGQLIHACRGAVCVVSALSGLEPAVLDAQTALVDAAVAAGVGRFIPSDFCLDYEGLKPGSNRNLDLRRAFKTRLQGRPIAATSVFNGAFTDMLTGQAPIILPKLRRVLYWGDADQLCDFTTMDDTAAFTALAAVDPTTPRVLRIAGDQVTPRGLAQLASRLTGKPFKLLRGGGLGTLAAGIKVMRSIAPAPGELYPPWQGMQYLHGMFSGEGKLGLLDNQRYGFRQWTTVEAALSPFFRR